MIRDVVTVGEDPHDRLPAPPPSVVQDGHPLARSLRLEARRHRLGDTLERLDADVKLGLGQHEFSLLYQPRLSLRTDEVVGAEALVRWTDSTRGALSPRAFLPALKQTGAMAVLGRWVTAEACHQGADWERGRPADALPIVVSVNITAGEVLVPGYVDSVRSVLEAASLPAELLQLELDANDQLAGDHTLSARLQVLRRLGVQVAIDSANPSFALGGDLIAADSVHVDRRWIRSLARDPELRHALASLVDRAHRSGATVCATGVEDAGQVEQVVRLGCDLAQGFHFCAPVPGGELEWLDPDER